MPIRLIVHGGAWSIPDEQDAAHLNGVTKAVESIYPELHKGMTALEAVEAAVNLLEADPTFDAGRGAFLNENGEIELDAIIADGETLNFGAVAAVRNLVHPVSLARRVLTDTEHCLLVGEGAQAFARKCGFKELAPEALLTQRELEFYHRIKKDPKFRTHHPFGNAPGDTVGAVAMDKWGSLAVATSTGGTPRKMAGRVGDSPVIGAGAYADNRSGAVSATGWGESILKVVLSKTVCDLFLTNPAMDAAAEGIRILAERVGGLGGVIGIDHKGAYAFAHNTPKMAFAYALENGRVEAKMGLFPG